jgi:P-type Cu+ transporter
LTQGKPLVAGSEIYAAADSELAGNALKLASALARRSNHPFSQAVGKLQTDEFEFTEWEEVRGAGVQAKLQRPEFGVASGEILRLGSLRWLREIGVDLGAATGFEEKWAAQGATLLGLAADKKLVGMLAVTDLLKAGAAEVVAELRAAHLKVFLLTGDNAKTAQAIGRQAGIDVENIFAEVRPEAKAGFIQDVQRRGERVAFVGDGINDAPALEMADLGIAVSQASDVAREAADVILLKSEIQAVPEALTLARATLRTIKQNLFWAFFYNVCGIPLAALGFMSPVLCALAMGLSDLVVIGNALRLLRWGSRSRGRDVGRSGVGQSAGR